MGPARRNVEFRWWVIYASVLFGGLAIAAAAYQRSYQLYFGIAWAGFVVVLVAWIWFPKLALAATIGLALMGDQVTIPTFPFTKNLSSFESIMYLADGVSLSPLEITTLWGLGVTAYRGIGSFGRPFRSAPLIVPFVFYVVLAGFGLARGLSRGGDTRAAMYEARPLLILPLLYLLIINVCTSRRDYRYMYWAALASITVQASLSLRYFLRLPPEIRDGLESLNQHGSAIGMNLLFMTMFTALAYKRIPNRLRFTLLVASIPVVWVYMVAQRRAAVVALGVGLVLFAISLFWRQRRTFWKVVPVATVVIIGYLGVFWTSQSTIAFPAQAVKTVIAPGQASEKDQSSDLYRQAEKLNLAATIHSSPVLGIGFGQAFYRPYPLANISVFEFHRYVPHNSLLWIWMKMGFAGLVAVLFLLGRSVMQGAARARAAPHGIDAVIALNAVVFVVMYTVFLYVDIAWEARNVVLLALAFALCTGPLDDERAEADRAPRPRQAALVSR